MVPSKASGSFKATENVNTKLLRRDFIAKQASITAKWIMDTSLNPADNYIVKENKQKKGSRTKRKGAIIVGNLLRGEKVRNANKLFSGGSAMRHTERSSGPEDNYLEAVYGEAGQGADAVSMSALGMLELQDR